MTTLHFHLKLLEIKVDSRKVSDRRLFHYNWRYVALSQTWGWYCDDFLFTPLITPPLSDSACLIPGKGTELKAHFTTKMLNSKYKFVIKPCCTVRLKHSISVNGHAGACVLMTLSIPFHRQTKWFEKKAYKWLLILSVTTHLSYTNSHCK